MLPRVVAQRKPNRKPPKRPRPFANGNPNAVFAEVGEAALTDRKIIYRRARAREATILAMHLHRRKQTTMSLQHEVLAQLQRCSPPTPGGTAMEGDFTRVFVHFVQRFCVRGWNSVFTREHGNVERSAADRAHVALARARSIPLVSHEGYGEDGSLNDSALIRREAINAGVRVLTARQAFEEAGINEEEEAEAFLARFHDRVPNYLQRRGIDDRMGAVLDWVYGLYRFILRGEVEGRETRVPVRIN